MLKRSPSLRRAWIEIYGQIDQSGLKWHVALLAEGVD